MGLDPTRLVLEEAVPSPTDVSSANPGISKHTFNVPVLIEQNDLLFTLRSDSSQNLRDVPSHFLREVEHFFGTYKQLEGAHVETMGWATAEDAIAEVKSSVERYKTGE